MARLVFAQGLPPRLASEAVRNIKATDCENLQELGNMRGCERKDQAHIQRALEFYKKHVDNSFEDHLRVYFSKMDDCCRECSHCQEIVQAERQARFDRLQKERSVSELLSDKEYYCEYDCDSEDR